MYISKFQILNYKSYRDSTEIELLPGFNIVTGQNNAGKTALLEALSLLILYKPHLSLASVPFRSAEPDPTSSVVLEFAVSGMELAQLCRGQQALWFPSPQATTHFTDGVGASLSLFDGASNSMVSVVQELFGSPEVRFKIRSNQSNRYGSSWSVAGQQFGFYTTDPAANENGQKLYFQVTVNQDSKPTIIGGRQYVDPVNDVRIWLGTVLRSRVYRFLAERFSLGQSPYGASSVLGPSAGNLPEVLNVLDENPARFQRLNVLLREILPQVRHVSIKAIDGGQVQIIVWPLDPTTERADLAIPLNECGSGVGQVLAILYVLLTSEFPRTIIVDEPQNFLHPGAVRKLVEILKQYPQHQYIFSTHSPTVISASEPATITMVKPDSDGASTLVSIDPESSKDLQVCLSEVGARLSDVFGADSVLWVEGETEQECFPKILRRFSKSLMGTAIIGVSQTGDFQGRHQKRVIELYRRFSEANTLLPRTVAFAFDRECLREAEQRDLERMAPGLVKFLPRRMYESYLLDASAIAATANSVEGFRATPVREEEIQILIDAKRVDRRYYCQGTTSIPDEWIIKIDSAKMLTEMFDELSETRVRYDKMRHSVSITEWLLDNRPIVLEELSNWLVALFQKDEDIHTGALT